MLGDDVKKKKKNAVLYNKVFCTDFSACRIAMKGIFLLPRHRVCVHKVEYCYQICCSWVAVYNIRVCLCVSVWVCVFVKSPGSAYFLYIYLYIYI